MWLAAYEEVPPLRLATLGFGRDDGVLVICHSPPAKGADLKRKAQFAL